MPSPFPGMNPYLEQEAAWRDFHNSFIVVARDSLTEQVRPAFRVKIEENLYVQDAPDDGRRLVGTADVAVADRGRSQVLSSGMSGGAAVLEAPVECLLPLDVERDTYLEVRDRAGNELVAVIELLSPTNKRSGDKREQYLAKRGRVLSSDAHLIEIDLLRGGPRMPPDDLPDCDYYALVSRVDHRPRAGVWPVRLRDPLPVVPIPLRPPHADARLDLKEVLDRVYDRAAYGDFIYENPPQPPLHPADAEWARWFVPR